MRNMVYNSIEICTGAGGEALGLEKAGFHHIALIEYEKEYCRCLIKNRPDWNVINCDVRNFNGLSYRNLNIDLLAGGVPCPPFSIAGKQLGQNDERDLFPEMIRLTNEIRPKIVMIENVKGFLSPRFDSYRTSILYSLIRLRYRTHISLINASDYGVPQLRPRTVIIAIRNDIKGSFSFDNLKKEKALTVGETLEDLMSENGWQYSDDWKAKANDIAPTIVGGSKKHGGPDLGPTRARLQWAKLGVDGSGVADEAPQKDFVGMPRLTPRMIAKLQGFPDEWYFGTKKTSACRMIGNAFPPPVAKAIGKELIKIIDNGSIDTYGEKKISQAFAR
jgi:DNA (cytosine-5)-methyltransferase 1